MANNKKTKAINVQVPAKLKDLFDREFKKDNAYRSVTHFIEDSMARYLAEREAKRLGVDVRAYAIPFEVTEKGVRFTGNTDMPLEVANGNG